MDFKTRKTERRDWILINLSLIVVIMGILIGIYFSIYSHKKQLNTQIEILNNRINIISSIIDQKDEDIKDITKQIDLYKNIDENTQKVKTEYFNIAKDLEEKIINGESDIKIAYLTFDDGPYYLSSSFLDVLDEYDVPATFFYLMKGWENGYYEADYAYDQTYRRIIDSGHTLGNHTATHRLRENSVYQSVEVFMDDLLRNRNFIENRYGYHSDVMRFPGGSFTSSLTPSIIPYVFNEGYAYVDWNVSCGDGGAVLSAEEYRDRILYGSADKKIIVVLMHDYSQNTLIALPEVIEGLANKGYIFLPLFHDSVMAKHQ